MTNCDIREESLSCNQPRWTSNLLTDLHWFCSNEQKFGEQPGFILMMCNYRLNHLFLIADYWYFTQFYIIIFNIQSHNVWLCIWNVTFLKSSTNIFKKSFWYFLNIFLKFYIKFVFSIWTFRLFNDFRPFDQMFNYLSENFTLLMKMFHF